MTCGRQGRIDDITGKGLRTAVALSTASCFMFQRSGKWQTNDPIAYSNWRGCFHESLWYYFVSRGRTGRSPNTEIQRGHQTRRNLRGFSHTTHQCVVALLVYSTDPNWIGVNCHEKKSFVSSVMCTLNSEQKGGAWNISFKVQEKFCKTGRIILMEKCYNFKFLIFSDVEDKCCHFDLKTFQCLFDAVSPFTFPPLIMNESHVLFVVRHFDTYKHEIKKAQSNMSSALYISSSRLEVFPAKVFLFSCSDGKTISAEYLCDGISDCPETHSADESQCGCQTKESTGKECQCSSLYNRTHEGKCQVYNYATTNKPSFIHENENNAEEESVRLCWLRGKENLNMHFQCKQPEQIPCDQSHISCFLISEICSFTLSAEGHLLPCRTGTHLQQCNGFECNSMFKCPNFYCIPWKFVCDGKWDCPEGLDDHDNCGTDRRCEGSFLCRKSRVCVHLNSVCDVTADCPLYDDESFCSLQHTVCPGKCDCLTYAVLCQNELLDFNIAAKVVFFKIITIQSSSVKLLEMNSLNLTDTVSLSIKHTELPQFCCLSTVQKSLQFLSLRFTQIANITSNCFEKSQSLLTLDLSNNLLKTIQIFHLSKTFPLKVLNLSYNPLKEFSVALQNLPKLITLSLLSIMNLRGSDRIFESLEARWLEVSFTEMCCLTESHTKCSLSLPWHAHCGNMLPDDHLHATFCTIPALIVIFNVFSLIMHRISWTISTKQKHEQTGAFEATVAGINLADISCSVPLCILCVSNLIYTNIFTLSFTEWRSSTTCFVVLSCFIFFNILSPAVMIFLSVSRFKIVDSPIDTKFKKTKFVLKWILGTNILCVFIAGGLTLLLFIVDINKMNKQIFISICSPFCDPTKSLILVKITNFVVIIDQGASVFLVCYFHWKMFQKLKKSQQTVQQCKSKPQSNAPLVVQITIFLFSYFITFVLCGIIYLCFMFLKEYSIKLFYWMVVADNTLNSLVSPLLFVFLTFRKLHK